MAQLPDKINHPELDGTKGTNRAPFEQCQIRASNDYEAILCWLNEYRHKATTYRSYQKETERLLLWCVCQYGKLFSSLDRNDFEAYFNFLDNPQPVERWCSPRGKKALRGSADWKPFEGPLSKAAKETAIVIINSLINYLVYARYLAFNPLGLMRNKLGNGRNGEEQRIKVWERILEVDEWEAMLETLEAMPEETANERKDKERLKFLVAILYFLGLRIHELETHTWGAFRKVQGAWWFFVRGKGDKEAKIPVNGELLQTIIRYRQHFLNGLPELPEAHETGPMIQSTRNGKPITARQMNRIKRFGNKDV